MTKKLYKILDFPRIEGVVYSEEDKPHEILGLKKQLGGYLIQAFFPYAKKVYACIKDKKDIKEYEMELVDEEGFFAVYISKLTVIDKISYYFRVVDETGVIKEVVDPYSFDSTIDDLTLELFNSGINYEIYNYLGAHERTIDKVSGTSFAVWAPNALRVSVVGDFNGWDGRVHQMRRLGDSGVFELFIPGVKQMDKYKYELKLKGDRISLKSDPYAFYSELRPDSASVVYNIEKFTFTDSDYIKNRAKTFTNDKPINIYECCLLDVCKNDDGTFKTYREAADLLCQYVKDNKYTHINLLPVMEHPMDESLGYETIGYFSVTSRYGTPDDFMYFVNKMHENNVGVILSVQYASFPKHDFGLHEFDGTMLYEHANPMQSRHPFLDTVYFNHGRAEVSNYIISNALFYINKYHVDGIKMDSLASMMYLDYGKNEGEYIKNLYGGNENLEAIEVIKHLNSINEKLETGAMIIADGSTYYPRMTESLNKDGLGFDYKFNTSWAKEAIDFMSLDPVYRASHYTEITDQILYAYSEKNILSISHDEVRGDDKNLFDRMPGEDAAKLSNVKALLAYMMLFPGKKSEFASITCTKEEYNEELKLFISELNEYYITHDALYSTDTNSKGFEWIDNLSCNENIVSFLRKADNGEELLVVCNFANVLYEKHNIGVPYEGKYKEVFNTDYEKYGGSGSVNKRVKASKPKTCNGRKDMITVKLAPLSVSVFNCIKA